MRLGLTKREAVKYCAFAALKHPEQSAEDAIKALKLEYTVYELKSFVKRAGKLSKQLGSFSGRAALAFIIQTARNPKQLVCLNGVPLKVLVEAWRIKCYQPERLNLGRGREAALFDLHWLELYFKDYCEKHPTLD